jgi:hypothetical protein
MATLNGLGRIVAEAEENFVKGAAMSISKLLRVDVLLAKLKPWKALVSDITKEDNGCVKGRLVRRISSQPRLYPCQSAS